MAMMPYSPPSRIPLTNTCNISISPQRGTEALITSAPLPSAFSAFCLSALDSYFLWLHFGMGYPGLPTNFPAAYTGTSFPSWIWMSTCPMAIWPVGSNFTRP